MKISEKQYFNYEKKFNEDKSNKIAQSSISKVGIQDSSLNQDILRNHNFVFSITTKKGEITNQKQSGRCWMFSALNVARIEVMKNLNIENFEFSQNYTLFYDKLEKANYFLESIIKTRNEKLDSRLISFLLSSPMQDGGQWDMFKGILEKYGAVPKELMPETFHSSNTRWLDFHLTTRLRNFAKILRESDKKEEELRKIKEDQLYTIYNILVKALGMPPKKFTYEYLDNKKNFVRINDITPKEFFNKYVSWNLKDKISLINAPTKNKKFGEVYTVKFLQSVIEADKILYLNVPNEILKEAAIKSLKNGESVWFGCDVGKMSNNELGIMDTKLFNFSETLSEVKNFDKASRLDYYESVLTHAMVFVGVNLDNNGKPINWMVENSWGDKVGKKGIFSMSDEWFDEYNYQIMIDKKYLNEKYLQCLNKKPIELEPWDPFGALAKIF